MQRNWVREQLRLIEYMSDLSKLRFKQSQYQELELELVMPYKKIGRKLLTPRKLNIRAENLERIQYLRSLSPRKSSMTIVIESKIFR